MVFDGFNTQPPEGGWLFTWRVIKWVICFNTQPPEGGWFRAAEGESGDAGFNTQPPEGGWGLAQLFSLRGT